MRLAAPMTVGFRRTSIVLALVPLLGLLQPLRAQPTPPRPAVAREFRGVWVASVSNIDWPSRPGLSTAEQQGELLDLLSAFA